MTGLVPTVCTHLLSSPTAQFLRSPPARCRAVDPATVRSRANRVNDYLLDRMVHRNESFTGINGINVQDRAIQESMGRVVDRSKEHPGPADKAIIQARKLLRQAVKTVEAGGDPDGTSSSYYQLCAHEAVLPAGRGLAARG